MKYLGGKHLNGGLISKILKYLVNESEVTKYYEPFCGSLGVLKHMTNYKKVYASDLHPDLILMWKEIKSDIFKPPKKITEKYYNYAKYKMKSPNSLKAFIGFGSSFGGIYFSSYAQKYVKKGKRDFRQETINSINRIKPFIKKKNVKFYNRSYDTINPKNSLIYCDPPYIKTTKYSINDKNIFDHNKFWNIMRKWSKNNIVVISEERAPKDFICIFEKKKRRTI